MTGAAFAVVVLTATAASAQDATTGSVDTTVVAAPTPVAVNDPPPSDPRIERDRRRHHFGFSVGLQTGITYWTEVSPFGTDKSIGKALTLGYNLGFRTSFEFFSWLALDGRLTTTENDANSLVGNGEMRTFGGLGAVRFTAPLPHIQPYLLIGGGGYRLSASGPKTTQLVSSGVGSLDIGLGATVPVGYNIQLGLEWMYAHLMSEVLSTNPKADGGDPSTFSLFLQYHLPI